MIDTSEVWFDDDGSDEVEATFKEYSITSTPNDFNIKTICDFVDSGVVKIPGFQRNYVWDIERASKLIESILIGLPIPQIFLYEKSRNEFLVIDGQQRLMSIYFFFKKRFPRKDKRQEIRRQFAEIGGLKPSIFEDDSYFSRFNLTLPTPTKDGASRFHGKNFDTLGDYQGQFNLSTIRNIVIKQTSPSDDGDSSIFEIFNRLNTGGVNLSPHEIRVSLYYSGFLNMIDSISYNSDWLYFTGKKVPDINLKDSEVLLRSVAMMHEGEHYREPMGNFLNLYAKKSSNLGTDKIDYIRNLINKFLSIYKNYPREIFSVTERTRFNISFFEASFRVLCEDAFRAQNLEVLQVPKAAFDQLRNDDDFQQATRFATGQVSKVESRYLRAKEILLSEV